MKEQLYKDLESLCNHEIQNILIKLKLSVENLHMISNLQDDKMLTEFRANIDNEYFNKLTAAINFLNYLLSVYALQVSTKNICLSMNKVPLKEIIQKSIAEVQTYFGCGNMVELVENCDHMLVMREELIKKIFVVILFMLIKCAKKADCLPVHVFIIEYKKTCCVEMKLDGQIDLPNWNKLQKVLKTLSIRVKYKKLKNGGSYGFYFNNGVQT